MKMARPDAALSMNSRAVIESMAARRYLGTYSRRVFSERGMAMTYGRIGAATAAIVVAGLIAAGGAQAQQFENNYSFTPRDARVAIALGIYQVENNLLGPGNTFIDQSQINCNTPTSSAEAFGNSLCVITRGDSNVGGTQSQENSGNQTSSVDQTTNGSGTTSLTDGIEAALAGQD